MFWVSHRGGEPDTDVKGEMDMRKRICIQLLTIASVVFLTACADPPSAQVSEAKSALDAAVAAGAEQYAPDKLQSINKKYEEAMTEIQAQGSHLVKNYSLAEFTLDQVTDDSNALRAKLASIKGEPEFAYVRKEKPFVAD